jgi:tetratricopeptide (TPR) repeat protein
VLREWQTSKPHAGGKRPLSGMVARVLMRQGKFAEAHELFVTAQKAVPDYTSWHLEYVYFALACQEKINGHLSEAERQQALAEIKQGEFLLRRGFSETGMAERHMGRLHQLRGEFTEAIPYLLASRKKLSGLDLVAADQALVVSYVQTKQFAKARELAAYGAKNAGQYAAMHRKFLDEIARFERAAGESTNAASPAQGSTLTR